MPIEEMSEKDLQDLHLHRMVESLEAINTRIARLAIALKLSLEKESEVQQVLNQATESGPSQAHQAPPAHLGSSPNGRATHNREELRGLLVLRYQMETHYMNEVGVQVTRQILKSVQEHMTRIGFKPGAEGVNLHRLFNEH